MSAVVGDGAFGFEIGKGVREANIEPPRCPIGAANGAEKLVRMTGSAARASCVSSCTA
jgi:hypothetical protein